MKKTIVKVDATRWAKDESKTLVYELQFKNGLIVPGTKFKLKHDRSIYTFHCLVHCKRIVDGVEIISSWVECMSAEGYKSVRPERISKVMAPKRSYKRNVN